jgi:hypothetical protein
MYLRPPNYKELQRRCQLLQEVLDETAAHPGLSPASREKVDRIAFDHGQARQRYNFAGSQRDRALLYALKVIKSELRKLEAAGADISAHAWVFDVN